MIRFKSLRTRMTANILVITALIMAVAVSSLTLMFDVTVQGQLQKVVDRLTPDIRKALTSPKRNEMLDSIARDPSLRERGMAFAIVDFRHRGDPLWKSRKDFPTRGNEQDAKAYRFIPRSAVERPERGNGMGIVFAIPIREIQEIENLRRIEFGAITFIILGMAGLGAWMLIGKTLSPIGRLSKQAANASVENLSFTLAPPSQDTEIVELVNTLNGLLGRIEQTSAAKGRFYAAASHELRTPLQALSGHLELALTRQRSSEEYEKVIGEAHRQATRLSSLVQELLLLHQLDTAPSRSLEEICLASVCRQHIEALAPLTEARHLTVHFSEDDRGEIRSIQSHADILVRNVLENAAKYSDEGGIIELRLTREDHNVTLIATNPCVAATDLAADKLFEPFYRPDVSRNSRTGGNGLGLAICKAIAQANGWIISVETSEKSVTVKIQFTVASKEPDDVIDAKTAKARRRSVPKPSAT